LSGGKPRGPVFEVKRNSAGNWYWHEKSTNGKIVDYSQAYAPWSKNSKGNALRAARRKASQTKNATVRILE
jgi:uncharacterized protein YegP (UPF0339 family)